MGIVHSLSVFGKEEDITAVNGCKLTDQLQGMMDSLVNLIGPEVNETGWRWS